MKNELDLLIEAYENMVKVDGLSQHGKDYLSGLKRARDLIEKSFNINYKNNEMR
jgi:hypothetical protein